jgi:hypothetical protein
MSTSSKSTRPLALALAAAVLSVPLLAVSGLVAEKAAAKPGGYTLRCWQEGRLIVEEQYVSVPPGIDSKLQVIDRHNLPMYVAETRNATCVVRARPPERPPSVLP